MKWNPFKKQEQAIRSDSSLINTFTGQGTNLDKLMHIKPNLMSNSTPQLNNQWWNSIALLRKIINCVAEDALKNGFKVNANIGNNRLVSSSQESIEPQNISRLIENRLYELHVQERLTEALRYLRTYSNGCLLYYIVEADIPQVDLTQPLPVDIIQIDSINVIPESQFSIQFVEENPLSNLYHKPRFHVHSSYIHPSRINWMVKDWNRTLKTGKSVLDDVLEIVKSQNIAVWSISNLFYELSLKIFKSPHTGKSLNGDELKAFLERLRLAASTQTTIALNTDEELIKQNFSIGDSGKGILDWITDNIAILSEIPQARLKGAAHGVLASGNYDMMNYFEYVKRIQKHYLYKPLNDIVQMVIMERNGIIRQTIPPEMLKNIDWEIEFNPLWELSTKDQAELEKLKAERDKLDIESGKITPQEARTFDPRFNSLEVFDVSEGMSNEE